MKYNTTSDVSCLSKYVLSDMTDFEEIIVLQRLGLEYDNVRDDLMIQIPGLTTDLKRLELKEMKIGINAVDVGSNTSWITFDIKSPGGGLQVASGNKIVTVPVLEAGGTILYRQYHHDNLVLFKLNCKQSTTSSRPIHVRILRADQVPLAKDYVYLRFGLFESHQLDPYSHPLPTDRFQAL